MDKWYGTRCQALELPIGVATREETVMITRALVFARDNPEFIRKCGTFGNEVLTGWIEKHLKTIEENLSS